MEQSNFRENIISSFEIEVNWTGELTSDDVMQLLEQEKRKHPNRCV